MSFAKVIGGIAYNSAGISKAIDESVGGVIRNIGATAADLGDAVRYGSLKESFEELSVASEKYSNADIQTKNAILDELTARQDKDISRPTMYNESMRTDGITRENLGATTDGLLSNFTSKVDAPADDAVRYINNGEITGKQILEAENKALRSQLQEYTRDNPLDSEALHELHAKGINTKVLDSIHEDASLGSPRSLNADITKALGNAKPKNTLAFYEQMKALSEARHDIGKASMLLTEDGYTFAPTATKILEAHGIDPASELVNSLENVATKHAIYKYESPMVDRILNPNNSLHSSGGMDMLRNIAKNRDGVLEASLNKAKIDESFGRDMVWNHTKYDKKHDYQTFEISSHTLENMSWFDRLITKPEILDYNKNSGMYTVLGRVPEQHILRGLINARREAERGTVPIILGEAGERNEAFSSSTGIENSQMPFSQDSMKALADKGYTPQTLRISYTTKDGESLIENIPFADYRGAKLDDVAIKLGGDVDDISINSVKRFLGKEESDGIARLGAGVKALGVDLSVARTNYEAKSQLLASARQKRVAYTLVDNGRTQLKGLIDNPQEFLNNPKNVILSGDFPYNTTTLGILDKYYTQLPETLSAHIYSTLRKVAPEIADSIGSVRYVQKALAEELLGYASITLVNRANIRDGVKNILDGVSGLVDDNVLGTLGWFRQNVALKNPVVVTGNVISTYMMTAEGLHIPHSYIWKNLKDAPKLIARDHELSSKLSSMKFNRLDSTQEYAELLNEYAHSEMRVYQHHGVYKSIMGDELRDNGMHTNSFINNVLLNEGSKAGEYVRKIVDLTDASFRITAFNYMTKELGMDAKIASAKIDEQLIDYSRKLPPMADFLRNYGVAPFINFSLRFSNAIWQTARNNPSTLIKMSFEAGLVHEALGVHDTPFGEYTPIPFTGYALRTNNFHPYLSNPLNKAINPLTPATVLPMYMTNHITSLDPVQHGAKALGFTIKPSL